MSNVSPQMNSYEIHLSPDVISALLAIEAGVVRVGVSGRATGLEGFLGCELELASGEVIAVCADQHDLEYKFEVFPISASRKSSFETGDEKAFLCLRQWKFGCSIRKTGSIREFLA